MKKTYQKWLLAAGIVAVVEGLIQFGLFAWVEWGNGIEQSFVQYYFMMILLSYGNLFTNMEMVQRLKQTLILSCVCNILLGLYFIFLVTRQQHQYEKHQKWLSWIVILAISVGGFSWIATILWIIANIKERKYRLPMDNSISLEMKQYQLLNAQSYARKLKELRDKGQISQEEFLLEIQHITEVMDQMIADIAKEKGEKKDHE